MIRWLAILIAAGQCYAGSTNWIAQRPGLVSDYGNFFANDGILERFSNSSFWYPFPANFGGTQYCFSATCTTDWTTISGATWTNEFGGGMNFDGNDYLYTVRPDIFGLYTNRDFTVATWVKLTSVPSGDTVFTLCGFSLSGAVNQFIWYQGAVGWYTDSGSNLRWPTVSASDHASKPTFLVFVQEQAGQVRRIYTNGILAVSSNYVGQADISGGTIWGSLLGVRQDGGPISQYMNGKIYDFLVSTNKAMTSNEQAEVYRQTKNKYGIP